MAAIIGVGLSIFTAVVILPWLHSRMGRRFNDPSGVSGSSDAALKDGKADNGKGGVADDPAGPPSDEEAAGDKSGAPRIVGADGKEAEPDSQHSRCGRVCHPLAGHARAEAAWGRMRGAVMHGMEVGGRA